MTFNLGTGELRFAPSPDQAGVSNFTVTASDGVQTAVEQVAITVDTAALASTEASGQVVDTSGNPWRACRS
jgi:hypothetical protein